MLNSVVASEIAQGSRFQGSDRFLWHNVGKCDDGTADRILNAIYTGNEQRTDLVTTGAVVSWHTRQQEANRASTLR